jgi:hypothetical protein
MKRLVTIALLVGLCVPALAHQDELDLHSMTGLLEHDLKARFMLDGQVFTAINVPTSDRPYVDYSTSDNALVTSMYLAALAMKYEVTKDESVRTDAAISLKALDLLCNVSGKTGLLARAALPASMRHDESLDQPLKKGTHEGLGQRDACGSVWNLSKDGQYKWRGNACVDQITAVVFAYSLAYDMVADPAEKETISNNVHDIVDTIMTSGRKAIGLDGKPIVGADFTKEYVTKNPMNALLILEMLKAATHVSDEDCFKNWYKALAVDEGYAAISVKARAMGDPLVIDAVNQANDMPIFFAYATLLRYEQDEKLLGLYKTGLERTWEGADGFQGVYPEGNPLFAFLVRKVLGEREGKEEETAQEDAMENLWHFPLDMKWNTDTCLKYAARFKFTYGPSEGYEGRMGSRKGLIWIRERGKAWSAWMSDPYEIPATVNKEDGPQEYNAHDFLIGYWFGRYMGYVKAGV